MKLSIVVPNTILPSETFIITQLKNLYEKENDIKLFSLARIPSKQVFEQTTFPIFKDTKCIQIPNNDVKKIFELIKLILKQNPLFTLRCLKTLNFLKYSKLSSKLI